MDLYSLSRDLPSNLLAVVFLLLVAVNQSYLVKLVLLKFDTLPIQQFFVDFLEVLLLGIAEEDIAVVFIEEAVEGVAVDEDLL